MPSKVHLITAHSKTDSFNYALRNTAIDLLKTLDIEYVTSDLYQMAQLQHPATRPYQPASRSNRERVLIDQEQSKIAESKLTLVQFPLYWFSVPGILKNYFDQVFEPGFAYPGKFEHSPLAGNRAVLFSTTTQSTASEFSEKGVNGPISKSLYHLDLIYRFIGFKILPPFVAYNIVDKLSFERTKVIGDFSEHFYQAIKQQFPELVKSQKKPEKEYSMTC